MRRALGEGKDESDEAAVVVSAAATLACPLVWAKESNAYDCVSRY